MIKLPKCKTCRNYRSCTDYETTEIKKAAKTEDDPYEIGMCRGGLPTLVEPGNPFGKNPVVHAHEWCAFHDKRRQN